VVNIYRFTPPRFQAYRSPACRTVEVCPSRSSYRALRSGEGLLFLGIEEPIEQAENPFLVNWANILDNSEVKKFGANGEGFDSHHSCGVNTKLAKQTGKSEKGAISANETGHPYDYGFRSGLRLPEMRGLLFY